MRRATAGPALLAGLAAVALHFAGALKSAPLLAALPVDLTLVAALALAAGLPLLLADRHWWATPGLGLPLAAAGGLWLWLVIAGAWSASRLVLEAKLPEAVLLGPAMLAAGMVVAGDEATLRHAGRAALAIGLFTAASVAWGVATDSVVLGGVPGAQPDQVRVQYQIAGLAIASAAAMAAVRAAEARRLLPRLLWLALVGAMAVAALLPGGRAALAALALATALAPACLLWRRGAWRLALFWPGVVGLAAVATIAAILAVPDLATGLRTVERFTEGEVAESSGRLPLWRAALAEGGANLPWGLGTGGFTIAAGHGERRGLYPHNHALEALAEGGLPGLLLWLGAFGGGALLALRQAGRVAPGCAARVAALALPVALSVMVSTDLGNRMAWFALGLALGLGLRSEARHVRPIRQA